MESTDADYAYRPSHQQIENARLTKFIRENNAEDLASLRARSVADPAWFWDAVVKDLGIKFSQPYDAVYDDRDGIAWTKWFTGAKLNIVDTCVTHHAKSRPDAKAIVWEGDEGLTREWTYAQLEREVNAVARELRSRGVKPGDVVGVYMPMIPEIVAAVFGIAKIGAIFLPLFSGYGVEAVQTRLDDADAVALMAVDGFFRRGKTVDVLSVASEAAGRVETCRTVIAFRRVNAASLPEGVVDWPTADNVAIETEQVDSEHPLFLAYTSGTTGRPKGVVHVHGGFLVKIAEEVAYQTDVGEEDVLFWFTDMGWIMGPWEVIGGCANGATVALFEGAPDYPSVDRLWSFCERAKVTVLGASPTLIRALMPAGEEPVTSHDLSRLRILASTGEPWNEDPWWWYFKVVGKERCPIINLSGGTEVGACFLSPHPIEPIAPMSLGGPSLGMAVEVFDDNGIELREAVGELVCTRPWPAMTRGLWRAPDRFFETYFSRWPNVWVHGDWASVDSRGRWFLHGRSDDTIKVAGKRIGPAEVESAAVSVPGVVEAAAIGYPDDNKGEVLWVYAVTGESVDDLEALRIEIADVVATYVGKSFKPAKVLFVRAIPKTRNGKVLRRAIRAVAISADPGDMSSLEDHATLDAIREAK